MDIHGTKSFMFSLNISWSISTNWIPKHNIPKLLEEFKEELNY